MIVANEREMTPLLDAIAKERVVGLDTEFHSEFLYRPQLALVQVALPSRVDIVDPIALGANVRKLFHALAAPEVSVVAHGASSDVEVLRANGCKVPASLFDTQLAAAFCGFGHPIGLAPLVEGQLGVKLSKGQTCSDWTQRPLQAAQVEYAIEDVRHLLPLAESLKMKLTELGRMEWFREESAEQALDSQETPEAELYKRIYAARRLDRTGLAVLRELVATREQIARKQNKPPQYLVKDGVLVDFAERRPRTYGELGENRLLHDRVLRDHGERLLEAIQKGLAAPEADRPPLLDPPLPPERALAGEFVALYARWKAMELGIPATILFPPKVQGTLARGEAPIDSRAALSALPGFRGWRDAALGDGLWDVLQGRVGIRLGPGGGIEVHG